MKKVMTVGNLEIPTRVECPKCKNTVTAASIRFRSDVITSYFHCHCGHYFIKQQQASTPTDAECEGCSKVPAS